MFSDSLEILIRGGPVMAPIIAVSVIAWTVVFNRFFAIRRESLKLGEFLWRLETRMLSGGRPSALNLCWESGIPIADMLAPLFAVRYLNKNMQRKAIQRAIEVQHDFIGRGLTLLAALAGSATLLGLLGTVTGMISTFNVVTVHGTGEPTLLAKGISQALITTETGLVVALPLLLMHSYLSSRAVRVTTEAHRKLHDISASLRSRGAF